ncbi:methyl-accepting chemotaxis protein [Crenobacter cavernae]|uniref:Methyl-accepting chemotaxis protein n=1 Tax=Crenobacter cavernae TaxID=2290923 RepID=A0ABY0FGJ7_9NEIS|nr:methyl-accepting chemotaxis protein [Crenobacter cavernae]RXZ44300.1 methyl-accepting chemotaxis protein [Crenobacter cavernae]
MAIHSITEWFIPERVQGAHDALIRARTVVGVALLAGVIAPLFAVSYFELNHPAMAYGILAGGTGLLFGPVLLRLTGAISLAAQFVVACMYGMVCWMVYVNGGILSTSSVWFASIPFAAVFVGGRRAGLFWSMLTLLAIAVVFLASGDPGALPASPIGPEHHPLQQAKSLVGLSLVVLSLAMAYDRAKTRSLEKLDSARADAERASAAIETLLAQVTRSIRAASNESRDIVGSTESMACTMADQRARAEGMMATAQAMAVMTGQNAAESVRAREVARAAGTAASEAGDAMDAAVAQLSAAREAIGAAAGRLDELGQKSAEVNGIVKLIRDIADQTNLLALNAAIEAARAGEMGRGFAVVADEVRKLAERTQNATQDIDQKISLIVCGTNEAIVAMKDGNAQMHAGRDNAQHAQDKLGAMIDDTHRLADVLAGVAAAGETQNRGFSAFAGDITAVAEATRALSEETGSIADATGRLDKLMAELGDSVKRHDSLMSDDAAPRPATIVV